MKIIALLTVSLVAATASADRNFHGNHTDGGGKAAKKIKTAANFGNSAAKIELCPSGDCAGGQLVTLSMAKLREIDASNNTVQAAANFASLNATWTTFEEMTINGVAAMTTSFVTTLSVGGATPTFNLTATIYTANGTALNGNQSIDVPAGALKFSVTITKWPFEAEDNRLLFGIELKARGKDKKDRDGLKKERKSGNHTRIERVSMGEGMFMDAPTNAVVDGVDTNITSELVTEGKKTEFIWIFPHFNESVYYDPVTGSEDASATPATETDTPTPSPTTGAAMSWRSVATALTMACLAAASALLM